MIFWQIDKNWYLAHEWCEQHFKGLAKDNLKPAGVSCQGCELNCYGNNIMNVALDNDTDTGWKKTHIYSVTFWIVPLLINNRCKIEGGNNYAA